MSDRDTAVHRMTADARVVRRGLWHKLRRSAGRVPFAREAVAAWCCATDRKTPLHIRAAAFGALAYFVMPADAVPDFIAALGYTDDITVFWAAWRAIAGHITEEHRERADVLLDREGVARADR